MDNAPGGARTLFAGGGHTYPFNNISAVPQRVANAAPGRRRIIFHNPGANDIFVVKAIVQGNGVAPLPVGVGSDTPTSAGPASLGGTFRVYANGGSLVVDGAGAGVEWQAFAQTGVANSLTVDTSNA